MICILLKHVLGMYINLHLSKTTLEAFETQVSQELVVAIAGLPISSCFQCFDMQRNFSILCEICVYTD